ncbi:MAG: hypothetical protein Q9228_003974 [Teloschistes exilis]
MKFLALEEWAAASAAYDADSPPYWHAKIVPDAFTALSGVLWSASYTLMANSGFKDKSYAMPIYSLCLNIAWETVFGFVYGPGLLNQIVFAQWMVVDAFLVYTTVKYGRQQWRQQPMIANNLGLIMAVGIFLALCLHFAAAATFVPVIGRRVVPFTAWILQMFISIGSLAQLISRGHTQGHTLGIWMRLHQPPVSPTPDGVDLKGKVALITGASAGIGQDTACQLLALNLSTLILGVRNQAKGAEVKRLLLADPAIKRTNPDAIVKIVKMEMSEYRSIKACATTVNGEVSRLDLLVLNAGMAETHYELAPTGHERIMQVNYLSNVLLLFELLPLLIATATKTGTPSRVTWVGSRMHYRSSLIASKPVDSNAHVLDHFDDKDNFFSIARYGDSKMLGVMFTYELAMRLPKERVVINNVCPGTTHTNMGDFLIFPLRMLFHLVHYFIARSVEDAGRLVVHAAVVAGPESHGQFLIDKDIRPPHEFITTPAGQVVQKKLWSETFEEMTGLGAPGLERLEQMKHL